MIVGPDSLRRLLVDEDWLDEELPAIVLDEPCEVALEPRLVLVGTDDADPDGAPPPKFRQTPGDHRII